MSSVVPTTALADVRPVLTRRQPIECLFAPRSIAVVGASDRAGSVGQVVLHNLRTGGFAGRLYAVNDKRDTVQGLPSVPSVRDLAPPIDLALIAVPAARVATVIEDCGRAGVRTALVLSAGFAECGPEGAARQAELIRVARANRVRLIGPNCVGVVRPSANLHAFFGHTFARSGRLALVSQSGALCTAILDWAAAQEIGFSTVASIGAAADVGFGELLDYLALDTETDAILVYAEGIDHARAFMSGLRAAARMKPVIVLKAGRHAEARLAAASHTGALIGDDAVFDAALRRAGALRVSTLEELFSTAELLASGARTRGDRLAIVTNAGGLGVMAADRVAECNVALAKLGAETLAALDAALPAHWSHGNPIDLIGDAPPERYARALDAVLRDPGVDGALVLLSPQAMTQPDEVARYLIAKRAAAGKPVLACFTGGASVHSAQAMLAHAGVPELPSPEAAVDAFAHLANFQRNQQLLLQVPATAADGPPPDLDAARAVIAAARRERRSVLSLPESKALLAAFRVPVTACEIAQSADAAVAAAVRVGMPVAMKVHSPDITHKSDAGGVVVGLGSEQAVREAFAAITTRVAAREPNARILGVTVEPMHGKRSGRELLAGIASDPAFGPVIAFGAGGTLVELIADRCIALPPLNAEIARSMIDRTRVRRLLGTFRGMPEVDLTAIECVLLRLSELACELPDVSEVDINPLIADENGVVAVDARVVLREPQAAPRYAHVAIEPYPAQLTRELDIAGERLTVRPIRPSDAAIERAFVHDLSFDSRYMRFHCGLVELSPAMLVRLTQIDYSREMAFIALRERAGREQAVGIARYVADNAAESCEFALTVADDLQGHGVGTALMRLLIEYARGKGLSRMFGYVLSENCKMLEVARALGFGVAPYDGDATLRVVTLQLNPTRSSNDA